MPGIEAYTNTYTNLDRIDSLLAAVGGVKLQREESTTTLRDEVLGNPNLAPTDRLAVMTALELDREEMYRQTDSLSMRHTNYWTGAGLDNHTWQERVSAIKHKQAITLEQLEVGQPYISLPRYNRTVEGGTPGGVEHVSHPVFGVKLTGNLAGGSLIDTQCEPFNPKNRVRTHETDYDYVDGRALLTAIHSVAEARTFASERSDFRTRGEAISDRMIVGLANITSFVSEAFAILEAKHTASERASFVRESELHVIAKVMEQAGLKHGVRKLNNTLARLNQAA
jgi:hypothetical protein